MRVRVKSSMTHRRRWWVRVVGIGRRAARGSFKTVREGVVLHDERLGLVNVAIRRFVHRHRRPVAAAPIALRSGHRRRTSGVPVSSTATTSSGCSVSAGVTVVPIRGAATATAAVRNLVAHYEQWGRRLLLRRIHHCTVANCCVVSSFRFE